MIELSKQRFDCLAGYIRHPRILTLIEEVGWIATDDERVLGLLTRDRIDDDFGWVALGRDERMRYRAVEVRASLTRRVAEASLREALASLEYAPDEEFHQGDTEGPPVDFFRHAVAEDRLHPSFRLLSETQRYTPARGAVAAMMHYHTDVDGNFVQQFQTTGFDARLWELYLFATMTELGYARDETVQVPDFVLTSAFGSLAMEAVTCNPAHRTGVPMPRDVDAMLDYQRNYIPIKLGRARGRKLRRNPPYWSAPEVADLPFMLAVQDFHAPGAMQHIVIAATEYAFGIRHERRNGELHIEAIVDHRYDGLIEPSGLFNQANAENVSAILLNPQGTITKFNRMGYLAGFGDQSIRMIKSGIARGERNRGDPRPRPFRLEVHAPGYSESWVEGAVVLHNPRARIPLNPALIPGAAHEFLLDGGRIMSLLPEFHPLFSGTEILVDDAGTAPIEVEGHD